MLHALDTFSTLIYFLAAAYYGANPIIMYMYVTAAYFARDSKPATAPQMAQQSGALSITPFRLRYL